MFRRIVCFVIFIALWTGDVRAQELRGSVQGVVADATGSVVVGAQVTLRNINTGIQVTRATGETGSYLFDLVSPGLYILRSEERRVGKECRL